MSRLSKWSNTSPAASRHKSGQGNKLIYRNFGVDRALLNLGMQLVVKMKHPFFQISSPAIRFDFIDDYHFLSHQSSAEIC
jgi:hypothetical protein